ncbi:MAG: glutamate--tRNA ligase [Candidatus Euphemobacter frigidus]|nr:glutamate--tRNA ligase [Candidatus Euphemobacter frigidus]MDP8274850.1 glutamate--tRNA ligase [Candidatus Euphemobacter frigidus]
MGTTTRDNHIRVRFAPSPTGSLHVGGVRTALFNWLFARGRGGVFILRIEDTDRKRSQEELGDEIIEELRWLGLDWDEGPIFQSRRFNLYRNHALNLLREGKAYRSEPDGAGGTAVILKVMPADITFRDLVYGPITVSGNELKDIVLLKSDGSAAYNFACVVDDHEMGITHVIRGEDHIPNTPKQLILYQALGWTPPSFAHLPLILGEDKSPLSKRHGSTSLRAFREGGFLPGALRNYLALLGWSPGGDRELLTSSELVEQFSLKKVIRRSAVFDYQKLLWMNGQYIRKSSPEELVTRLQPLLADTEWGTVPRERLKSIVSLLGHRLKSLKDFTAQAGYFIDREIIYDPAAVSKYWTGEGVGGILTEVKKEIASVEPFTEKGLEKALRGLMAQRGIKGGDLIHPLRVAITGQKDSPGIFEILLLLGRERVLSRLEKALAYIDRIQK